MYDIIIVGAGPAGLTAAIYASRANKKVLVFDKVSYGGQIINSLDINNYPLVEHISGYDFVTKLYNHSKNLGSEFIFEEVIGIRDENSRKVVKTSSKEYYAKCVVLATGAYSRKLGLDKEEELVCNGISYCATCDGALYKGKDVCVVGGGNTALEDALYLSGIANKVYLIHRSNTFRAEENLVNLIKTKNNVTIMYNTMITNLKADEKLNGIELTNNNGNKQIIDTSGLFVAIGRIPETKIFSDIINVDSNGYVISDENCNTNISGIFVCGDNRTKELRQLVTATCDGAVAATNAINYINNNS